MVPAPSPRLAPEHMKPETFLPAHIAHLPAYTPIEPFEILSARIGRAPKDIIKLDANENPYGMSPRARQALVEMDWPHIYPDPESRALRSALAAFTGAPAENLLPGSGADELIDLTLRVLLSPGEAVINCPPTFGMYAFDADLNAARVIEVFRNPADFALDLDGILAAIEKYSPKLLFLTSPNNPDGSLIPEAVLQKLFDLPLMVVLDEAYIEFADPAALGRNLSHIRDVPGRDNLIVLRTFSKLAGLAGLRVGYGAFPDWLMPGCGTSPTCGPTRPTPTLSCARWLAGTPPSSRPIWPASTASSSAISTNPG